VIDLCFYPLPAYQQHQQNVRRMGLGATGLADAMVKMKMPYGRSDMVELTEEIYRTIAEESYRESIRLAQEKGAFPYCENDKHAQGYMISKMDQDIAAKVRKHGIRNGYLTSQQPSGTGSLLAGVWSGIEPIFDYDAIRQDRIGKYKATSEAVRIFKEVMADAPDDGVIPAYFTSANDISAKAHVQVQAAAQRWNDSAISKTVNAPQDFTKEQTQKLYEYAYDEGLRTIAFYRDRSRDKQVLYHGSTNGTSSEGDDSAAAVLGSILSEVPHTNGNGTGAGPHARVKLPVERHSITHRFQVGEQEGYITVGLYPNGTPGEIFVTISKEGSTIRGLMDAFATSTSIALQHGVDLKYLCNKFQGSKFEPAGMTQSEDIRTSSSLIDYIFRWLRLRFVDVVGVVNEPMEDKQSGHICPDCGVLLIPGEGCESCPACDYTKCG